MTPPSPKQLRFRIIFVLLIVAACIALPEYGKIVYESLAEAFLQVSAFVAITLWVIFLIEKKSQHSVESLLTRFRWAQVPAAAFLGALPGCGGAVVVITQYTRGSLHFGGVVAVLTSTMGDAAFLLIAQQPLVGFGMVIGGMLVGIISGYIVQFTHPADFLLDKNTTQLDKSSAVVVPVNEIDQRFSPSWLSTAWNASLFVFVPLAFAVAFQLDLGTWTSEKIGIDIITLLGASAAIVTILWWLVSSSSLWKNAFLPSDHTSLLVLRDTAFITFWVVLAYLAFELSIAATNWDLQNIFAGAKSLTPLIAIVVGFIPGCGPQLIITTIYLQGFIPLSAQIGNAIANDGDALFPVLAIHPRAALIATVYSAIPALIFAYGFYWLFE